MVYTSLWPDLPLPKCNILSFIFPQNKPPSDEPLWIDAKEPEHYLSPRQALSWIKRLGYGLDRRGIGKQEVVMLFSPNHIFIPVAFLAIAGSSRIFSAANPDYTAAEVAYQLKNTGARLILAHPDLAKKAVEAAMSAGLSEDNVFLFSDKPCQTTEGVRDWREGLVGTESEGEAWQWDPMQETSTTNIATINFSSGTTGLPKGVMVSHHNILTQMTLLIFMRDLEQPYRPENRPLERWLGFLPLYHAYGQLSIILMAPYLNFKVYVMKMFVFEDFLKNIQNYKITELQVAPPIMIMLDKRPETQQYDLSSVGRMMCGAAPLKKELQNSIARKLDCVVFQGWGMTELTLGSIIIPGGRVDDSGSVGWLIPNTECKLLDDNGKEVKEGEPGEIHIRAPNVCLGYWRNEQATKEAIQDGWLKTGDVAVTRNDQFWIVDRKKELIKVNAFQVAPAELEGLLVEHPSIADAAVTGIQLGNDEWPRAYVALQEDAKGKVTEKQIQDWLKERVSKHKQLVGGVKFVDVVPKLASGKIQRKIMREWSKRDAKEMDQGGRPRL